MTTSRTATVVAAACVAAVAAPPLLGSLSSALGDAASFAIRLVTSLLAVVLLLRRTPRGADGPLASSRLFAAALVVGALAALVALTASLGVGSKQLADLVYLGHVPLAALGLMLLPVEETGGRVRFRALLDGAIAVTSLAFVVRLALPGLELGTGVTQVDLLAISDVFLVATMLGLLPRVRPQLRRYLVLTSCGLVLLGAANLQKAIVLAEGGEVSSHGLRTALIEVALLLLVAGAAQPLRVSDRPAGWRWPALAPYVPVVVALGFLVVVIAAERPLETAERVAGTLCFLALLVRHAVASWDSAELLERLRAREGAYRQQALEDALTGLPNRRSFLAALEDASASDEPATLLLVDCDGFKQVNDTQGHDAGDAVLRHVGTQMARAVGDRGTVARLGGDEFAVLLHASGAEALHVAQQLQEAAAVPLYLNSRATALSVSVGGAASASASGGEAKALLAHADVALYRAKAGEGGGLVLLDGDGRADAARQLQLRDDIARPRLSEFSVVYQPLFDGQCEQLRGAEALLRWEHPVIGPVPPSVFIPLAEQTGAIEVLGAFVLQEALAQLAAWRDAFPHHRLAVGVNVSPQQLGDGVFASLALDLLRMHGLDPSQLVVELTEEAFISDLGPIAAMAKALRQEGVSVAVDDFGTGYASLRYLESIPSDVLKIDRSFVSVMTTSPGAHALVRGVLALARELDLQCVAEGVETVEQQALLRELGCEVLQGYLLGRPGPPEAIAALLAPPVIPAQRGAAGVPGVRS